MKPVLLSLIAALGFAVAPALHAQQEILNASYDVSRELFADVNKAFVPYWKEKSGQDVQIKQSHAGSSKQALAIREGLPADVVTFNQVTDIDALADSKLVARDWATKFPNGSSPYYSVHTILVRKGNPKGIHDWSDLAKPGVAIVQVNPKTGGNGRYAALAYYAYALDKSGGDAAQARAFLKSVLANVVVFDTGGRGATTTFAERGIGDVLVTFESEALSLAHTPDSAYEVVTPTVSIVSEFPVAIVDRVAKRKGTAAVAKAYLDFLYTPQGQDIVARNFYRPRDADVAARYVGQFTPVKTLEVGKVFGSWDKVTERFFANGALIDTLLKENAAEVVR